MSQTNKNWHIQVAQEKYHEATTSIGQIQWTTLISHIHIDQYQWLTMLVDNKGDKLSFSKMIVLVNCYQQIYNLDKNFK